MCSHCSGDYENPDMTNEDIVHEPMNRWSGLNWWDVEDEVPPLPLWSVTISLGSVIRHKNVRARSHEEAYYQVLHLLGITGLPDATIHEVLEIYG